MRSSPSLPFSHEARKSPGVKRAIPGQGLQRTARRLRRQRRRPATSWWTSGSARRPPPTAGPLTRKRRLGRRVKNLNATVMTLYLWHMAPVIVIAVAFYPTGVMPQPAIGTAQWWELRPAPPGLPFSRRCWCRSSWRSCGRNGRCSACPPGSGHGGPVAAAPAARYRRLDGRPGQARDGRIRPGRGPGGACPGGLRRRPARDPVHRPRPAGSRPAQALHPEAPHQPFKAA